jgi:hypothetical protein
VPTARQDEDPLPCHERAKRVAADCRQPAAEHTAWAEAGWDTTRPTLEVPIIGQSPIALFSAEVELVLVLMKPHDIGTRDRETLGSIPNGAEAKGGKGK